MVFRFSVLVFCLVILSQIGTVAVAQAQEFTFSYHVRHGDAESPVNCFGVADGASSGIDAFDLPQPPPVPEGTLNTYLSMLDPSAVFPNRWLYDIRPVQDIVQDRVELWPMTIEGVGIWETVTLTIGEEVPVGIPYQLYIHGPGVPTREVTVPGTFEINLSITPLTLYWELHLDSGVASQSSTWGGIKSLYH